MFKDKKFKIFKIFCTIASSEVLGVSAVTADNPATIKEIAANQAGAAAKNPIIVSIIVFPIYLSLQKYLLSLWLKLGSYFYFQYRRYEPNRSGASHHNTQG
jgi:hypothetical protein